MTSTFILLIVLYSGEPSWEEAGKSANQKIDYLVKDEWALQATFAGSICQQVGLHLLQAGQPRATGTAHTHKK